MLNDYQKFTQTIAIYHKNCPRLIDKINYITLGLSSESGEISSLVKKLQRDGEMTNGDFELTPAFLDNMEGEIGDAVYYLANLAENLGMNLEDIIKKNQAKLESRKARGVLGGSGSNR